MEIECTWSASCQFLASMRSARASVTVQAHALASARASSRFLTFLMGLLRGRLESSGVPGNSPAFQCLRPVLLLLSPSSSLGLSGGRSAVRALRRGVSEELGKGNSPAFQWRPASVGVVGFAGDDEARAEGGGGGGERHGNGMGDAVADARRSGGEEKRR
ncbi:hypothetical protein OsI_11269 [Oryza sativa Indica Group]|uniref:Uncharacterized protein n=1 Tax=Oryza sativa subsp. indica TaxID=39946 RepID=B8AMI7_ORYSI|nr:hypothetical protein OsI_11269 [Oryza sativa Indica Group]